MTCYPGVDWFHVIDSFFLEKNFAIFRGYAQLSLKTRF